MSFILESIQQLSLSDVGDILKTAEYLQKGGAPIPDLQGKVMALLFFEPSTRTACSFQIAAVKNQAHPLVFPVSDSSMNKGETLEETLNTLFFSGVNLGIIRHTDSNIFNTLRHRCPLPLINAGNGTQEHPTQALIDFYILQKHFQSIHGITVGICGDIAHSRVARSNAYLLKRAGAEVRLIGPEYFRPNSTDLQDFSFFTDMREGMKGIHALIMLRIQTERLSSEHPLLRHDVPTSQYLHYVEQYTLNEKKLEWAEKNCLVLHPGPVNIGTDMTEYVMKHYPYTQINAQVSIAPFIRASCCAYVLRRSQTHAQ